MRRVQSEEVARHDDPLPPTCCARRLRRTMCSSSLRSTAGTTRPSSLPRRSSTRAQWGGPSRRHCSQGITLTLQRTVGLKIPEPNFDRSIRCARRKEAVTRVQRCPSLTDLRSCGDLYKDCSIHDFDYLTWILGEAPVPSHSNPSLRSALAFSQIVWTSAAGVAPIPRVHVRQRPQPGDI